jgi:hypothetical protein
MVPDKIGWYHPIDESDQWDGFHDSGIEHFRGRPIMHLAREAIQNAIDARLEKYVVVDIRLEKMDTRLIPGIEELKQNIDLCYEAALKESIEAKTFFLKAREELSKNKINVLVITDSNTSGMVGPCKNGTKYFAFMKAKGQSRKDSETATGSYGIGKLAPYASSNIRTIFVSTVYEEEDGSLKQLTQGKSILMSHDNRGKRRMGTGFWGVKEKCQPVEGINSLLSSSIQLANTPDQVKKGTKIAILCFALTDNWKELLSVSVAENFFGAISDGTLIVKIENLVLNKETIESFFNRSDIRRLISDLPDEPDNFDDSGRYFLALQDNEKVKIEESEMRELGRVQLRVLVEDNLPKKVCVLRNGMFITDRLNRLKSFSDCKDFIAVIQCMSKKGNELLRMMEPPRHDAFEPSRLHSIEEQRRGARALKGLATWVRDMLKRHAKEPVSKVTEIDELRDYFGEEGKAGTGKGTREINPYGEIHIRARPLKMKNTSYLVVGESQTKMEGKAIGEGLGSQGSGESGRPGLGNNEEGAKVPIQGPQVKLKNVRAIVRGEKERSLAFTPTYSGTISLYLLEAGADSDYKLKINKSNKGILQNGCLVIDVEADNRFISEIELMQKYHGAIKVIAHEI